MAMRKNEIEAGKTYTNGLKGVYRSERTVEDISLTGAYVLIHGQEDIHTVKYSVKVRHGKIEKFCTMASFAQWARYEVGKEPVSC